MNRTTTQITDEELTKKLQECSLDPNTKYRLEPLIPQMTDEEKEKLMELIEKSMEIDQLRDEDQKRFQEGLANLNEEYEGRINDLSKNIGIQMREEYEKVEQKETEAELEDIEKEINKI